MNPNGNSGLIRLLLALAGALLTTNLVVASWAFSLSNEKQTALAQTQTVLSSDLKAIQTRYDEISRVNIEVEKLKIQTEGTNKRLDQVEQKLDILLKR